VATDLRRIKADRASYTALDFNGWRETQSLVIAPGFQRRSVWGRAAKAYLIDTILRGLPVPPIYLRVRQSEDKTRTIREVIDGQQRISAVLDYVDGRFALSSSLPAAYAGKEFGQLTETQRDAIRNYSFLCEVFQSVSDAEVLEIFARLNTFSVQLNAQELRNGRYFGFFKQTAYALAYEHVEFWRRNRILTERGIARMDDAELTSELMIMQLDGLQDKKTSINTFYAEYEDSFRQREQVATRFRATIDTISGAIDFLGQTDFRRRPLFYSLFGAVYHRRYGVPGVRLQTPRKPLTESERRKLRSAVADLTEILMMVRQNEPPPRELLAFVNASQRQTDNIQPRGTRLEQIYRFAF